MNELVISIVTIIHKTADLHNQLEDILRLQYLTPDAFFTPAIRDVDPWFLKFFCKNVDLRECKCFNFSLKYAYR